MTAKDWLYDQRHNQTTTQCVRLQMTIALPSTFAGNMSQFLTREIKQIQSSKAMVLPTTLKTLALILEERPTRDGDTYPSQNTNLKGLMTKWCYEWLQFLHRQCIHVVRSAKPPKEEQVVTKQLGLQKITVKTKFKVRGVLIFPWRETWLRESYRDDTSFWDVNSTFYLLSESRNSKIMQALEDLNKRWIKFVKNQGGQYNVFLNYDPRKMFMNQRKIDQEQEGTKSPLTIFRSAFWSKDRDKDLRYLETHKELYAEWFRHQLAKALKDVKIKTIESIGERQMRNVYMQFERTLEKGNTFPLYEIPLRLLDTVSES